MTNEFHTLRGTCSSLVPSGPGYEGVSLQNQVCTTLGAVTGQDSVDGNVYVGLSFGYSFSHLWMVKNLVFHHLLNVDDEFLRTLALSLLSISDS
jgi:ABC-type multidrug transport system permease subunit